jgi:triacylglycerol lipase
LAESARAAHYPVGVIAGDSSINPIGSMIIPGADDGTVSVESAKLAGMTDFIEMNVTRTFIMQDDEVGQHVLHFLEFGRFGSGGETRD